MNRIRLLPDHVANQIAAGEVVDRPASVIKELVENALDAGAGRIVVEIGHGGKSLMRVTDDGEGMGRDDAILCLERHATSKITKAEDLAVIGSFGFRGEALPSIASVSRFVLKTHARDAVAGGEGTEVIVQGGRIVETRSTGCPAGTSIEVKQLFFNLPARRKFLRSDETEASHVEHYLSVAALAYSNVGLTYIRDGATIWQFPALDPTQPKKSLEERLVRLYGKERLIEVDFTSEMQGSDDPDDSDCLVRVWGFIGAPGISRSSRDHQHFFVNRRPVDNRALNFAIIEGYHNMLMKGRYPVGCLFLELDPGEVDVNIHPAKREVKFRKERSIRGIVTEAVRTALVRYHKRSIGGAQCAPVVLDTPDASPIPVFEEKRSLAGTAPVETTADLIFDSLPTSLPKGSFGDRHSADAPTSIQSSEPPAHSENAVLPTSTGVPAGRSENIAQPDRAKSRSANEALPLLEVPLRILGVVGKLYVVMESDRGMVLLDQHAAHERVLYEQMLEKMDRHEVAPSQRLLLPQTMELSAQDRRFLLDHLDVFQRLGVGLHEFGDRSFMLDALPVCVKVKGEVAFVAGVIDELKAGGLAVNTARLAEEVIAKTVCRHAVKANDALTMPEIENLVASLRQCQMPYTCPHGRPTILEMNYRDLEKRFGRQA